MSTEDHTTWPWKPESSLDMFVAGEKRRLVAELAQQPDGWWIRVVITHGDTSEPPYLSGPYKTREAARMAIGPLFAHLQQRLDKST